MSATRRRAALARALKHPAFAPGLLLVGALAAAALLSLVWAPYDPAAIDIANRLRAPSAAHWLGTDSLGRDITSQLLVGSRSSITVGVAAVAMGALPGIVLGCLAAARAGWVDLLVTRVSDLAFAFPAVLTAVILSAAMGPGLLTATLAIGLFNIPVFARVSRTAAQAVWTREYVLAAQGMGRNAWAITRDHVLPNIAHVLVVQATVQFAIAILAEAALSYLGLGTQPPQPSWGRMLNEAQQQMFQAPWLALFPGAAIALAVLGLNLLGDGLRDLLDPRLGPHRGAAAPAASAGSAL